MDHPRYIDDLADELLSDILSFLTGAEQPWIEPPLENPMPNTTSERPGERCDLDRFRLVCKRFMRIATPRKFSRFVLRFSKEGFQRLEDLLRMDRACHVKYFTYMVRPFYQGSGTSPPVQYSGEKKNHFQGWTAILAQIGTHSPSVSQIHTHRLFTQQLVTDGGCDLILLRRAMEAFSSLRQIKLLRLQDQADEQLLGLIKERSLNSVAHLSWEPACSRAIANLGVALLESNCCAVKFVGPQISPDTGSRMLQVPSTTLSALGQRLTSLDVNFYSSADMTSSIVRLSAAFRHFFLAATSLTDLHLGFSGRSPLDLKLEQVLHGAHWKRLRAFSLQGWRLGAGEIVGMARRHRRQLQDLRLSHIYLREGGRWSDILLVLHDEMERLERLDLREIDYAKHLDAPSSDPVDTSLLPSTTTASADRDTTHDTDLQEIIIDDYLRLPWQDNPPRTLSPATVAKLRALGVHELGDNGAYVRREQRVLWEAWVIASR
ncbi:hypothetical protein ASPZODRAFT_71159 [Penicilliopsis zonata CBS 506.65]|uniref:F-box domain-containing protein n=1 Tax=Penicilliopsis zonata CBS 506.65 TaxID=1073090 RepID=A0A1L9SBJ8_9EURO|nr:hypothetical protein ASPZODRAFT_71159 [Penicilliopsis zonata CBS 506.65]OJJ44570.1 hypothetical protein ASPZODRAFT_71159 [Penicilliopsis zonata CBS 506.65]